MTLRNRVRVRSVRREDDIDGSKWQNQAVGVEVNSIARPQRRKMLSMRKVNYLRQSTL